MYERSAIVLEKYFNKVFGFNESNNLKKLYNSYNTIIEETCKYQEIIEEEATDIKKGKVRIPWYVIGFFVTCALFSLKIIPNNISHICKEISNNLEIIALAAIGLRVNVRDLLKQGKAVSLYALGVGTLQIISALALIAILL